MKFKLLLMKTGEQSLITALQKSNFASKVPDHHTQPWHYINMSLTSKDLQEIRKIVEQTIKPLTGQIQALNEDIKEIIA